jgi:hypothetical protein
MTRSLFKPALLLALLPGACAVDPASLDTGTGVANPRYDEDIAPILAEHCTRCHDAAGRMAGGVALNDYTSARSTRVTGACTAVSDAVVEHFGDALVPLGGTARSPCADIDTLSMPPGATPRLGLAEQLTYARWVAQGAPR